MATHLARNGCIFAALALASAFTLPCYGIAIWDGGGSNDNWTTGANWLAIFGPGAPPANNGTEDISMPSMGGLVQTPIVDVPYSIRSLTFGNGNGRFVILGAQELTIGVGGITNNDADIQSLFGPVKLSANHTWNAAAGPLHVEGVVNLNRFILAVDGAHPIDIPNPIIGSGDPIGSGGLVLASTFASTMTLTGSSSNTYDWTWVRGGTLRLQKTSSAIAVPGRLTINSGGSVVLAGNEQISHAPGTEVIVGVAGTGSLNLNGYTETIDRLTLDGGSVTTGAGTLNIGHSLSVIGADSSLTGNLTLGDVDADVMNAGQLTTASNLIVGHAAMGTLDIESGGDVSNGYSYIGYQSDATGTVTVNGAGSTWTNSSFIGIGEFGSGELHVQMGGRVTSLHATVGQAGPGTAVVAGTGSMWTNSSFLEVANTTTGTLTIEAGGRVSNTNGYIGRYVGGEGTVVVRGTDSTWTNARLDVGLQGEALLNIEAGGKVTAAGDTNVNSASQVNVNGGTLDVDGRFMLGGSLTADAGATVEVQSANLSSGATISVRNASNFAATESLLMESNTELRVDSGAIYSTGFTSVGNSAGPAAKLIIDGANTLVTSTQCCIDVGYGGTGVMSVTGGARVDTPTGAVGSFQFGSAPSIGTLTLDGTDASGNPSAWINAALNVGLSTASQGTINIRNGALFRATSAVYGLAVGTPGTGSVFVEGTDVAGNPSRLDVARLMIGTGGYGNGTGQVTASAGGRIDAGNVLLAPTGGSAVLTITDPDSSLTQSGASTITIGHASDGMATLNVKNNGTLTTGTGAIDVNTTGQINLESGAMFDARGPINLNGGQFNFLGGTLHVANFNGNLLNQGGTLAPGHSVGTTATSGNYTQRAAAGLEIEIGGILPGDWDMLTAQGNASLDGTLEVVLVDDFEPVIGNAFTIISTNVGNVGGQFDTELWPVFNGLTFDVIYNPKSVVLQVIEAIVLAGDYNGNGSVDAADYVVWRKNEGTMNALPNDPLGGTIDSRQYAQWRANFGRTVAGRSAHLALGDSPGANYAVPEPNALVLLSFGVAGLRARRIADAE